MSKRDIFECGGFVTVISEAASTGALTIPYTSNFQAFTYFAHNLTALNQVLLVLGKFITHL